MLDGTPIYIGHMSSTIDPDTIQSIGGSRRWRWLLLTILSTGRSKVISVLPVKRYVEYFPIPYSRRTLPFKQHESQTTYPGAASKSKWVSDAKVSKRSGIVKNQTTNNNVSIVIESVGICAESNWSAAELSQEESDQCHVKFCWHVRVRSCRCPIGAKQMAANFN